MSHWDWASILRCSDEEGSGIVPDSSSELATHDTVDTLIVSLLLEAMFVAVSPKPSLNLWGFLWLIINLKWLLTVSIGWVQGHLMNLGSSDMPVRHLWHYSIQPPAPCSSDNYVFAVYTSYLINPPFELSCASMILTNQNVTASCYCEVLTSIVDFNSINK